MTNREVVELWNALMNPSLDELPGAKFGFALAKNKSKLKGQVKMLNDIQEKPIPGMEAFDKARIELCKEFADTDDDGNPIKSLGAAGSYQIIERRPEFENKFIELKEDHSDAFVELESRTKEFEELLGEENTDVVLHMIDIKDVSDKITKKQMDSIYPLIKD